MKNFRLLLLNLALLSVGWVNAQTARVQVIHNSSDTAAATVDVWLNNTLAIDDFNYRTATPFLDLPSNTPVDITIQPSNSVDTTSGLFRQTVNLDSNQTYIVIANGIISASGYSPSTPFGLDIFANGRETSANGATETDVLVYHGSTDAPTVDVVETSVPAGTIVDNASYSDFAGYLQLAVNDYTIEVRDSANSTIVANYSAPLQTLNTGGLAITVLASGFLDSTQNSNGASFGLFAALPTGGPLVALPELPIPTARVQVIHNSADLAASKVDVWLNDGVLLDDFEFRTASPFVDAQAGVPFVVSIADSASTDTAGALAQYTFTLEEDSTYIIVANGIVSPSGYSPATPFNLDVFASGRETSANGATETDVLVYHGSTDAPTVDVVETSVPAGTIVDNASYSDFAGYLQLAVNDYTIEVRDSANSTIVANYSAPLQTLNTGGLALTVLASGFLDSTQNSNGASFGLFAALPAGGPLLALPELPIPTARVQVIHNSADLAASKVDVWLNDGVLLDDFEFRTASPFVDAQAGVPFVVSIADSASTDTAGALAQYTFTLEEDSTYIIVANGIVSPSGYSPATPFNLDVFASGRETSANGATETDVLVYHGSTDAPNVDVNETSVPAGQLVDDIAYSEFDGYLELSTNDYVLEIADATSSTPIASFNAPLSTLNLGGAAITVLASGFADPTNNSNDPAFGLYVALASGGALVPLNLATSIEEMDDQLDRAINIYPNPSNGEVTLSYDGDGFPESLEVMNLGGQIVKSVRLNSVSTQNINLNELSKGIYFVRIIKDDAHSVKRLIIK